MERLLEFVVNNWWLFLALAMVIAWMLVNELSRLSHGVKQLDTNQATRLFNRENGVFVDVRSEAEFRKGHLPGAFNIPDGDPEKRNKKLDKHKKKPIIVYCLHGMTAGKAGKKLKALGYEQVSQLKGGYAAWESANLPIESR